MHSGCGMKASTGFGGPGQHFNTRELNCGASSLIIVSLLYITVKQDHVLTEMGDRC